MNKAENFFKITSFGSMYFVYKKIKRKYMTIQVDERVSKFMRHLANWQWRLTVHLLLSWVQYSGGWVDGLGKN